ncbi:MAG: hypothetical protein ACXAB2_10165 [Candidatus Hodarchaeales archaeon]|jgi:hypothetical protein
MAEMQRKKEKEEKKEKSVKVLEEILKEVTDDNKVKTQTKPIVLDTKPIQRSKLKQPQSVQQRPPSQQSPPVQTQQYSLTELQPGRVHPRIKPVLPSWVSKPWRWMTPEDPQLKEQWLLTWGDFILAFSRVLNLHILDIQEASLVYPFQNGLLKKKLSLPQLKAISEYLIEQNKAIWWDSEETRLRIYWRTLKSFAEELFEYSFQNGHEMVTSYDLIKMNQPWSTLPAKDLYLIMKIMVKAKKASWADTDRKTIEFHFT